VLRLLQALARGGKPARSLPEPRRPLLVRLDLLQILLGAARHQDPLEAQRALHRLCVLGHRRLSFLEVLGPLGNGSLLLLLRLLEFLDEGLHGNRRGTDRQSVGTAGSEAVDEPGSELERLAAGAAGR
jgi:hypothetical protein